MRKKLTAVLLAATMLLTSGVTVFADRVDAVIDKPYLARSGFKPTGTDEGFIFART